MSKTDALTERIWIEMKPLKERLDTLEVLNAELVDIIGSILRRYYDYLDGDGAWDEGMESVLNQALAKAQAKSCHSS